jgi:hypothetical protein
MTAPTPSEALAQWPQITSLSARLKAAEHLLFLAATALPVGSPIHRRIVQFLPDETGRVRR